MTRSVIFISPDKMNCPKVAESWQFGAGHRLNLLSAWPGDRESGANWSLEPVCTGLKSICSCSATELSFLLEVIWIFVRAILGWIEGVLSIICAVEIPISPSAISNTNRFACGSTEPFC
jgi:hypothetical protein